MHFLNRLKAVWGMACLGFSCAASVVQAQDIWLARTVRLVVLFPEGGASTAGIARAVAQELAKELNTTVIVETRPGGATSLGTLAVNAQRVWRVV
jgi:tripartite-type tricarboxylate transporter receptor subunit TctC